MTQTTAEQRAEAARLLAQLPGMWVKQDSYSDMDYVLYRLAPLVPALLADAAALAAREADDGQVAMVMRAARRGDGTGR